MTNKTFEEREDHIRTQRIRKRRLKQLVDVFHRCRSGPFDDYGDSYSEFEAHYLGPRNELYIPRYASCVEDESYGMIHLFGQLTQALSDQANAASNGEYLNVPAGIYDLDGPHGDPFKNRIETRSVELTAEAYAILCGIVAGSHEGIDGNDIYSEAWEELRDSFPVKEFREYVKTAGDEFYTG